MPEIRLSANGQIELPGDCRRALGLKDGDHLRLTLEGNRIALTPVLRRLNLPDLIYRVLDP